MLALAKTKMFLEHLVFERIDDAPPGSWGVPISQTDALDTQINEWVDRTGARIQSITAPGIYVEWLDDDKKQRRIVSTVMVTYLPGEMKYDRQIRKPGQTKAAGVFDERSGDSSEWEPVIG